MTSDAPAPAGSGRRRGIWLLLLLGLAWLVLGLLALLLRRGPIEADLTRRAMLALGQADLPGAAVSYAGRDATLRGTFRDAASVERARAVVAGLRGTRAVRLVGDVRMTPPVARLVLDARSDSLTVRATVPDAATRGRLLAAAVAVAGQSSVIDRVTVDAAAGRPPLESVGDLVTALVSRPGDREVRVDGARVTLSGTAASAGDRAAVGAVVLATVRRGTPGARLDNRLRVVPPAAQAAAELRRALNGKSITFASGDDTLDGPGTGLLDEVAAVLARHPGVPVLVAGHADSTGSADANLILSRSRAASAARYLERRGVPAGRVRTTGYGADRPVAGNDTEAGRHTNRRVEVTIPSATR